MRLAEGDNLGRYKILAQIGRGGMATVYRAFDAGLARNVAIKVLPETLADDPNSRERFQQEAQAVARLRHHSIPTVFEFGEEDGVRYIATELVDGGTLADRLGTPLTVDETVRLLTPIATAIDYAHSQGILHRDIKPSNILLTPAGEPMLADFGLARMMDSIERLTLSGTIIGTPEYMSPEQCAGEPPGPAGDIYSLAVVAYEMLTGRVPFSAVTPAAVIMAQMLNPLPPPRSINSRLSTGVEEALLKGLSKDPAGRYRTASELVEAIGAAAPAATAPLNDGWETQANPPPVPPPPPAPPTPPAAAAPEAARPGPPPSPAPVRTRSADRQPPPIGVSEAPPAASAGGGRGSRTRLAMIAGTAVIGVILLGTVGYFVLPRLSRPPPPVGSHATLAPASPSPQVAPTPSRPAQAQEAPLPEARQEQAMAALGDKLYVMAGFDANRNDTDTTFVYSAGTWARGPKLPIALDHPSAATLGSQLLIAGGNSQGKASAKVFALSPAGDAWNNAPSMRHARGALALISAGGKLYAIGGIDTAEVAPAESLSPGASAWTDLPPLPKPRDHVAGFAYKGMPCIAGGRTPNVARVDCYDPASNSWKQLPDLPAATSGAGGASFGTDEVVVAGGEPSGEAGPVIDQLARFVNGAWVAEKMIVPRHGLQLALASDGRVWACGGATQPAYAAVATCTSIGPVGAAPKG